MTSCSALAASEPLAGTAPVVTTWLIVEHAGPWGSHAPQSIPEFAALKGSGITVLFARRPNERKHGQRFWIASASGVHHGEGASDAELVELARDPALVPNTSDSLLFVCTNGARDACCATVGRKLAVALADNLAVWECTHLGGHRFAPTALALPTGNVHGRLTQDTALEVLEGASTNLRGSSYLDRRSQAEQIFGTTDVVEVPINPRPESCGGEPVPGSYFAIASSASR